MCAYVVVKVGRQIQGRERGKLVKDYVVCLGYT